MENLADVKEAYLRCVRHSQRLHFQNEIKALNEGRALSRSSRLSRLSPFLDESSTLRVGGRLQESQLPFAERHPAILTGQCQLDSVIYSG